MFAAGGSTPARGCAGALADVYGLDLTKVHWVEAEPNSLMSVDYPRDPRFSVSKGGDQVAELESGELDAVLFDRAGPPLDGNRARLFEDPLEAALTLSPAQRRLPGQRHARGEERGAGRQPRTRAGGRGRV